MKRSYTAYIALGSNIESPLKQLHLALDEMAKKKEINQVVCSNFYQSKPLGPEDQPSFFNACCRLSTSYSPIELLSELQHIELKMGRVKKRHWGERCIDLDIVAMFDQKQEIRMDSLDLILPHKEMQNRDFVLVPLKEVMVKDWHFLIDKYLANLTEFYIQN